jgi:uncharacterized protein (DUF427 family)
MGSSDSSMKHLLPLFSRVYVCLNSPLMIKGEATMQKAIWNGTVLAESDETIEVEGNQYFPPSSLHQQYFKPSTKQTLCPWKGEASYYNVEVDGQLNKDAAWYYPTPKPKAESIANYVAFWHGVEVVAS